MKAIVLSGFPAAGKTTAAKILSEKLNLPVIGGGEILKEMALDRGYKAKGDDWWDTSEGMKFLKERESNKNFDKEVDGRLAQKIEKGDIVITSYTAPWIIKGGFKIWLAGTPDNRAKRMSDRDDVPIEKSKEVVKARDIENTRLYKNLYGINFGVDLKPFDLIIDTNGIPATEVADIIIKKIKELKL